MISVVLGAGETAHHWRRSKFLWTWPRNAHTDLVNFTLDKRNRLVGRVDQLAGTMQEDELLFAVSRLAIECDRLEYVLAGRIASEDGRMGSHNSRHVGAAPSRSGPAKVGRHSAISRGCVSCSERIAMNHIVESLAAICRDRLLAEKWLIAPSLRVGHQWLDAVTRSGQPAINVRVKTLRRLALELAGPAMASAGFTLISDTAATFLVRPHPARPEGRPKGLPTGHRADHRPC